MLAHGHVQLQTVARYGVWHSRQQPRQPTAQRAGTLACVRGHRLGCSVAPPAVREGRNNVVEKGGVGVWVGESVGLVGGCSHGEAVEHERNGKDAYSSTASSECATSQEESE